jgi:hypothetical protein
MINRHVVMIDNHGGGARGGAVISAGDSGQRSKNRRTPHPAFSHPLPRGRGIYLVDGLSGRI